MTICEYHGCQSVATINWNGLSYMCDKHGAEATAWLNLADTLNSRKTPISIREVAQPLYKDTDNPCLYVVTYDDNAYKIGIAADLRKRMNGMSTSSPHELRVIHVIYSRTPGLIEIYLHDYFKAQRIRGEWFRLSNDDIGYIKTRAESDSNAMLGLLPSPHSAKAAK